MSVKLLDLAKAFQMGWIQKKLYWRLVRERMRVLVELQRVIAWNDSVNRIEIRKHAKRFGYHPNEIIDYMRGLGYCCTTFRNHGLVELSEMTDETQEVNFFFLHQKHHADILKQHLTEN